MGLRTRRDQVVAADEKRGKDRSRAGTRVEGRGQRVEGRGTREKGVPGERRHGEHNAPLDDADALPVGERRPKNKIQPTQALEA